MFLHERTVEILLRILEAEEQGEKIYPLQISREVGSPYSYVSKVLSDFEENWLIETWFEGKMRVVRLTEVGKKIAEMLKELKLELEKDFKARRRLKILEEIVESSGDDTPFKLIAPVVAELELLRQSTNDYEVVERVESLKTTVSERLKERMIV
jgi:predicted transcriptional regulator